MDFWILVERSFRQAFLGKDWRITIENPAPLLNFSVKGLTRKEIEDRVNLKFDSGSFPIKVKVQTPQGDRFYLSRLGNIPHDAICTGQTSKRGQRYLTFESI